MLSKIKKVVINCIAFFIFNRKKRKKFRSVALYLNFKRLRGFFITKSDKVKMQNFISDNVQNDTVLIIEPNYCHGETLMGYAKYFIDLGYNVDVIMNEIIAKESPFCMMTIDKLRLYRFRDNSLFKILKHEKVNQYKIVFVNSLFCYFKSDSMIALLPSLNGNRLLCVAHDISHIASSKEKEYLRNGKIVSLGQLKDTVFVNPHYFGDIQITAKSNRTTFITVGRINASCKNYKILITAIQSLKNKNLDFKMIVIGKGTLNGIPKDLHKYIEIKGRLDFPSMFKELEQADFFLPLLDPDNKPHKRYITTGVTGSAQLIYGFRLPPVIENTFSEFYGFNNQNAVIYNTNDNLAYAMENSINLSSGDYHIMQNNLNSLSDSIYDQSLKNLKEIICK